MTQQDRQKTHFFEDPLSHFPLHHLAITHFEIFSVELKLVPFRKLSSYYPINNIVFMNTKSKNNHTKNSCMVSTLHSFCPPQPLNNTIIIPTATIFPLCLFTHPLKKALNKYTSHNVDFVIKSGISYQKTPKYLPTISQIIWKSNYSLLYPEANMYSPGNIFVIT